MQPGLPPRAWNCYSAPLSQQLKINLPVLQSPLTVQPCRLPQVLRPHCGPESLSAHLVSPCAPFSLAGSEPWLLLLQVSYLPPSAQESKLPPTTGQALAIRQEGSAYTGSVGVPGFFSIRGRVRGRVRKFIRVHETFPCVSSCSGFLQAALASRPPRQKVCGNEWESPV